mgnify:CR=1 FL=1
MRTNIIPQASLKEIMKLDEKLSMRQISLDPNGYFIIKLDMTLLKIIVEHYENDIDGEGRAIDKKTKKPIGCKGEGKRQPKRVYSGKSAKEVGIKLTECQEQRALSKLDHALYIGRELQKAEYCLVHGEKYIQD